LSPRSAYSFVGSLVCLIAALGAQPVLAAEPAWDQGKVTQLAAQLSKSCDQLYTTYWKLGGQGQVGTGDASDVYALQLKLQQIQTMTQALAGALVSGKNRAQTKPLVEDIGEVAWDARVLSQRMFVESPLVKQVDEARAIWLKLIPYYGIKPPPKP
jgi:hypothetical protein